MDPITVFFGCLYFFGFAYIVLQICFKDWTRAAYAIWITIILILLGTWYLPWKKPFFSFPILFLLSVFSFHSLAKNKDLFAFILSVVSLIFILVHLYVLSRLHI